MLIEFRVTNFLSFKDEQTFTFVADASKKETLDNSFTDDALGKYSLVRSAVFYGANASGKTNFFEALRYVQDLVLSSKEQDPNEKLQYLPFALDEETKKRPSLFEIMFAHNGTRYEYGFSLDAEQVYEEWLFAYPNGSARAQRWFERPENGKNVDDWYFNSKKLKGEKRKLVQSFIVPSPNRLFLSVASLYNEQLREAYEWFERLTLVGVHPNDSILGRFYRASAASQMMSNETYRNFVLTRIREADLGIMDVNVYERKMTTVTGEPKNSLEVDLYHQDNLFDEEGTVIRWFHESTGTKAVFALAGIWHEALDKGSVLIVDEMDTSLHPDLVREFVRLFHDPATNKHNAQLIFNTHDTTLLDLTLFRRDQIWFIEKDHGGRSKVYSLLEFAPRKGEALQRGYMEGRYGALPLIGGVQLNG